ncbi:MAG: FMN reductase [Actinomycetota bacterium]
MVAPLSVVAVSGSLHAPSKSTALLGAITDSLAKKANIDVTLVEVSALGAGLGGALTRGQLDEPAAVAIAAVEAADLLVVASPVYRASYTGLFKHLFDLVPQGALAGTPVIVAASGGSDLHSLVIEHELKPLFAFFDAATVPLGVYAKDADYSDYAVTGEVLLDRIERATSAAAGLLERR